MRHTSICMLRALLLSTLFMAFAEADKPVLSVSPSWLSPGASVTLSCEVKPSTEGWSFFWYKVVPRSSSNAYSFELLPGSSNGTKQNSFNIHELKHTAGYQCGARKGEQKKSETCFAWSADFHPAASLTVTPNRVQHFTSDSVTLSCGGNSADWRVIIFTETGNLFDCSMLGNMTGSSCTMNSVRFSGVYCCASGSGVFSNAVNITVQNNSSGIILESPALPVTEGDPVTLSCRLKEQKLLSDVFFYHNNKLLPNDSREELKISAVLKSDEGFYRCEHSGKTSPQSWMSVRAVSPVSSAFPVLLIAGLIIGIILIIPLLLLWCYRKFKGRLQPSEEDVVYTTVTIQRAKYNSIKGLDQPSE